MKAVNLYLLTRVKMDIFQETYKALANFEDSVHEQELLGIQKLLKKLEPFGIDIKDLEDFWYSYRIPHISKEFDLIKLEPGNLILNIELKSGEINTNRIKKQLLQNITYLKHFKTDIISFTFVSELDRLYYLDNGQLVKGDYKRLAAAIKSFKGNTIKEDLDSFFSPSIFLVSPLNHPERFLNNEYFLTEQQKTYKNNIIDNIAEGHSLVAITGEPGTGKTLLMFDLAKELSEKGRCLLIHGASLCDGHKEIDEAFDNIDIIAISDYYKIDYNNYDYIFIDELQRIFPVVNDAIQRYKKDKSFIVSFDEEQMLSIEKVDNIQTELSRSDNYTEYKLTNLFRVNKRVAAFYRVMFDLTARPKEWISYTDIEVIYADNIADAEKIVDYYKGKDYVYIKGVLDDDTRYPGTPGLLSTEVIGQEYDKVITAIGPGYRYDDDGLLTYSLDSYKYDMVKLLYQNVTRTREKLCLLIFENKDLYRQILDIRNHKL